MLSLGEIKKYLGTSPASSRGLGRLLHFLPLLVLVFSLSATYLFWNKAQQVGTQHLQADFDFRVREMTENIHQRLLAYEYLLRGAQSLFAASNTVERDEFHAYINNLHLEDNYPGIQGVGFSLIVPPEQKQRHIAAVRAESFRKGERAYHMWPEGKRDLYTSIVYLEPFVGRNLRAFGYDMYSEPVRRKAMERARDTGKASMSGKVLLVQETEQDVQAGFLIYLPVYRQGVLPASVAERRANIIGWVYAPFRMNDLMHGIGGERSDELDTDIFDGDGISKDRLMYDLDSNFETRASARFRTTLPLDIAGHRWTLSMHSSPPYEDRLNSREAGITAVTGIAASLLLALLTWSLARGREHAIAYANKVNRELLQSEERYHLLFDSNPMPMWVFSEDGLKFLMVNQRAIEHYGYTHEEFSRMTLRDIRPAEDIPVLQQVLSDSPNGNVSTETRHRKKDGSIIHVHINSAPMKYGDIRARIVLIQDISERKEAEAKLQKSEAHMRAILDNVPYLIWLKDIYGRFIAVNKAFFKTTGLAKIKDVLGKTDLDLWPGELAEKYRADDAEVLSTRKQKLTEEMSMDNGEIHWVETFKAPVMDMEGNLLGTTGFAQDITARKSAEGKIRHLAHYDPLTDLPNRILFSDRLQQALIAARRDKAHMALMFIDLDKFKPINDELGHHVGDLLLKEVAQRMLDCVRESDTVARIGGDEFVVLLPVIEAEQDALLVAEKIRGALNTPFALVGRSLSISSSTGIAVYPEHGTDETQLMKNADTAMYLAKESGRDTVKFYHPDLMDEDS